MSLRACSGLIVLALVAAAAAGQAQAPRQRRVALVVGNDRYAGAPLQNARRDATAIADELRTVGFQTTLLQDATRDQMVQAITALRTGLTANDIVFFYYAGHGVQIESENYLIPIDYKGDSEQRLQLEGIPVGQIQTWLMRAQVAILVLDACRNNPYAGQRALSRGLAPPIEARGTLVLYAAASGQTAGDNPAGGQGTFTGALLEMLRVPGLTVVEIFRRVRDRVLNITAGRQFPALYDNLVGDVVLRPIAPGAGATTPSTPPPTAPPPPRPAATGSTVVPDWLVGDFRGVNPATNTRLEITVQPDGSITGFSGIGSGRAQPVRYEWVPSTQQIRDATGAFLYDVERASNGFRTRQVGVASNTVAYQRVFLPPGSGSAATRSAGPDATRQPTPDELATMVAVIQEWKPAWETLNESAGRAQFPSWSVAESKAQREKEGISKVSATSVNCQYASVRRDQAQVRCQSSFVIDYKQPLVSSSRGRVQIGGQKPSRKATQNWTFGLFWNGSAWLIESFAW